MSNKMLPSGISVRIREDLIDGASRTQTTLIIDPIITLDGHRVTMDDIGDIGYGKLNGGNAREELMSWTGITDNTSTYTLTGCTWGINFYDLNASVDNRRRHTSGNKFEIKTDMHYVAESFRDNDDNDFSQFNELKLGDGTSATDKQITAQNGDATEPSNLLVLDEAREKAWHFLFGNKDFNEVASLLLRTSQIKRRKK